MKYEQMCKDILVAVGGVENISDCYNCMTRLRLVLADISKADTEAIKQIKGVMGVNVTGSQLQCIIGPNAGAVCADFCELTGFKKREAVDDPAAAKADGAGKKKLTAKGIFSAVVDAVSNCIQPLLPIMIASGMFKMICAVFGPGMLNVIPAESNLFTLFTLMGDVPFYFLPVLIGYSAAKYFGVSLPLGMVFGAAMLHPTFTGIVAAGEAFTIYGIPMQLIDYSSSIIPMILCVWVMSYVEKFFKKIIPDMFKMMLANLCTLLVMLPLGLCLLAPLGTWIGTLLSGILLNISNVFGPVGIAIVCTVYPLLIVAGMHMPIAMAAIPSFFATGVEYVVLVADSLEHFANMGIALAYAIRSKDKEGRSLGVSAFVSIFLGGVVEPTLFGIAIPHRRMMVAMLTGCAAAGLFAGIMHVGFYTYTSQNVLNLLSFAGGPASNFIYGIIACGIAFAVAFVMGLVFGLKKEDKQK